MSQACPQSSANVERPSEETHMPPPTLDVGRPSSFPLSEEANPSAPTLNRYWRLFNDSGFSPPMVNPGPPLKPSSISSFDQLVKEFELNFLASSLPRPNAASLLSLSQGSEESLLKPSSISLFDQLVKEFELNFLASSLPRPNAASLLGLSQGSEESLV
ncbi:hypothetical protein BHM03_00038605 [Ensete ventricosum]|nr:hypothetical protein BHM03_00038605 [Ensete ventricosum]